MSESEQACGSRVYDGVIRAVTPSPIPVLAGLGSHVSTTKFSENKT